MYKTLGKSPVLVFVLAIAALALVANINADEQDVFLQIDLLVDVRHELSSSYVEKPDDDELVQAAVRGMVESLNDPFTTYLPPKALDSFDRQVHGRFTGIGAEIDIYERFLRIVSPLEDSPAWKAGILAGDMVLEIDGQSTENITVEQAIEQLTGEAGTDVKLLVRHLSGEQQLITVTRDVINVGVVRSLFRDADGSSRFIFDPVNKLAYIRLSQFTDASGEQLHEILTELRDAGMRGLILDVRFNPGGLLSQAVDMADLFLEPGKRIVTVRSRIAGETGYDAKTKPLLPDLPMVVLINEASASASEVLAGALSDHGRALCVGTRTFGKGSVQQVRMLESGQGAIKITHAHYYLPSDRNIHRTEDDTVWGVDPSPGCYVRLDADALTMLVKERKENPLYRPGGIDAVDQPITPTWIETNLSDPQLAASHRALLGKLESGKWPSVGQDNTQELAMLTQIEVLERKRSILRERLKSIEDKLVSLQTESTTPSSPATSGDSQSDDESDQVDSEANASDDEPSGEAQQP